MKNSKLIDVFKNGNIVIPLFFLKNYKKWNLKLEEFIFLMYFYNLGNQFLFDPNKFSDELNLDLKEVMGIVDQLTDKGFIQVKVLKGEKGLKEEVVVLDDFYQKIALLTIEEVTETKEDSTDIFTMIEKEFGRTLSPIEYELIKAWLDNHIKEELIREALKEATYNGVANIRYIDKILYEWGKAGIDSVEDVELMRKKRNQKNKNEKDADIDMDIVDWNWFDEDE